MSTQPDYIRPTWQTRSRRYSFTDPTGEIGRRAMEGATIEDLRKFAPGQYHGCSEIIGNKALNKGLQYLIELVTAIDPTATKWDAANAQIIVGDQDGEEDEEQTQLEAQRLGTDFLSRGMDAGFPQREEQTMIFRSSFLSGTAAFPWKEWGVGNGVRLLNRKVDDIGTKPAVDLWILEVGLTWY